MSIEKIAVIDCDSLAYSIFHPNKEYDDKGNPIKVLSSKGNMVFKYREKTEEEILKSADYLFKDIMKKGEFTHYIGFIKGSNSVDYKRKVLPEYKLNRSGEEPKHWKFVKNDLLTRFNVFEANNAEVDDYVNAFRLAHYNSHICAIDSDLLALEGYHYNWRKNYWIYVNDENATLEFWKNIICGTHNNTKGIPGKGVKFFNKVVGEKGTPFSELILHQFIKHFGEHEGIKQFYQNYICCKTLDRIEGIDIKSYKPILYE